MIPGRATADATKEYADNLWKKNPKLSPDGWKIIEGCTVSKIGFGSYRILGESSHEKALRKALLSGINLIDTASNYTDGQSEVVIGRILSALISNGELKREEVMLITKGGYIQGTALHQAKNQPPKEVVKLNEGLWYSIHPDNLKMQMSRSLERLNVQCVDGYLLHNPEYILGYKSAASGDVTDEDRSSFYQQVQDAFVFLEEKVKEGVIGFYGVSSNSLGVVKDQHDHIDLSRLFEAAQTAAQQVWGRKKRPAFRCVQLPINLMELGALHAENNTAKTFEGDEAVSVLELASRMHLTVLANRPLNAFPGSGGVFRLAEGLHETDRENVERLFDAVKESETALHKVLDGWPQVDGSPLFSFMHQGEEFIEHVSGSIQYERLCTTFIYPYLATFNQALDDLTKAHVEKAESIRVVQQSYNKNMRDFLSVLRCYAQCKDAESVRPLELELRDRVPEKWKSRPLQQLSLNAIASLPGVSCVLCGLRQESYVDDAIATLELGNFADPAAVIGSH